MTIRLTQWLCPSRHCSFALPWDDAVTTAETMVEVGNDLAREAGINPYCGICGAPIAPESAPTGFATVASAIVALADSQTEQLRSRRTLDRLGLTKERLWRNEGEL